MRTVLFLGVEHAAVSRTVRPEPLVLPPTSSRSPLKQGPEEKVGEQAVLSHICFFDLADRTVIQMFARSALS